MECRTRGNGRTWACPPAPRSSAAAPATPPSSWSMKSTKTATFPGSYISYWDGEGESTFWMKLVDHSLVCQQLIRIPHNFSMSMTNDPWIWINANGKVTSVTIISHWIMLWLLRSAWIQCHGQRHQNISCIHSTFIIWLLRTRCAHVNKSLLKISYKFANAVDLNICLKQI